MRSKLGKALRQKFEEELKKQYPQFEEDKKSIIPSGCRLYMWKLKENLFFFVELVLSPKDDSFTIQIGWSKNNDYPLSLNFDPQEISSKENSRFRMSLLVTQKDYWWYLAKKSTLDDDFFTFVETPIEESLEKISPTIDEVFNQIKEYVIPYFEKVKILLTKVA
jgi:hypothetical protein